MILETEIRKMRLEFKQEIAQLRQIICTRMLGTKWVNQDTACALLNVKPRQLSNIRVHLDKNQKKVGTISWKKGKGRNILYHLPDIEKYNGEHVIMN